jgi:hypothetical protein
MTEPTCQFCLASDKFRCKTELEALSCPGILESQRSEIRNRIANLDDDQMTFHQIMERTRHNGESVD